jgi:hypothetical protein
VTGHRSLADARRSRPRHVNALIWPPKVKFAFCDARKQAAVAPRKRHRSRVTPSPQDGKHEYGQKDREDGVANGATCVASEGRPHQRDLTSEPEIPAPMADSRDFGNGCPFLLFNDKKMSASIPATIPAHPNNPME